MSLVSKPILDLGLLLQIFVLFFSYSEMLQGTLIALREADNCAGCHKPGRSQRPFLERRCTLDCQGCHVDPTGAGPRNQWGYYYSQDQSSLFHYQEPIDPLQDTSRFDLHFDGRVMQWDKANGERTTFPMAFEPGIRIRPFINYLHLTIRPYWDALTIICFVLLTKEIEVISRKVFDYGGCPFNTYVRYYRELPCMASKGPITAYGFDKELVLISLLQLTPMKSEELPNVPFFRVSKDARRSLCRRSL